MHDVIQISRDDTDYPFLEVNYETIGTCHLGVRGQINLLDSGPIRTILRQMRFIRQ